MKLAVHAISTCVSSWKIRVGVLGGSGKVAAMIDFASEGAESPIELTAMTLN